MGASLQWVRTKGGGLQTNVEYPYLRIGKCYVIIANADNPSWEFGPRTTWRNYYRLLPSQCLSSSFGPFLSSFSTIDCLVLSSYQLHAFLFGTRRFVSCKVGEREGQKKGGNISTKVFYIKTMFSPPSLSHSSLCCCVVFFCFLITYPLSCLYTTSSVSSSTSSSFLFGRILALSSLIEEKI